MGSGYLLVVFLLVICYKVVRSVWWFMVNVGSDLSVVSVEHWKFTIDNVDCW